MSGQELRPPPRWLIGTVENPFAPPDRVPAPPGWRKKVAAGAEFVQTQYVFDVGPFARVDVAGARPGAARALRRPGRRRADPIAAARSVT